MSLIKKKKKSRKSSNQTRKESSNNMTYTGRLVSRKTCHYTRVFHIETPITSRILFQTIPNVTVVRCFWEKKKKTWLMYWITIALNVLKCKLKKNFHQII